MVTDNSIDLWGMVWRMWYFRGGPRQIKHLLIGLLRVIWKSIASIKYIVMTFSPQPLPSGQCFNVTILSVLFPPTVYETATPPRPPLSTLVLPTYLTCTSAPLELSTWCSPSITLFVHFPWVPHILRLHESRGFARLASLKHLGQASRPEIQERSDAEMQR